MKTNELELVIDTNRVYLKETPSGNIIDLTGRIDMNKTMIIPCGESDTEATISMILAVNSVVLKPYAKHSDTTTEEHNGE